MTEKTIIIWFRNDLRIHDNEILIEAVKRASKVVPVYCFDPRYFIQTKFGTKKTGTLRAKFLLESVGNLRASLRSLGGDLVIRVGKPEEVLPELCALYKASHVYHHREVAHEETHISAKVEDALWKHQINLKYFVGHTLYHKEDLPFSVKNIPDSFSVFRKKVERDSIVRAGFGAPAAVAVPKRLDSGVLPTLSDLGFSVPEGTGGPNAEIKGGESEALLRMKEFFQSASVAGNKGSRTLSFNLSPWLSLGCLSSRQVYWATMKYAKALPDLASKVITELQWRDYLRFMVKKHGNMMLHMDEQTKPLTAKEKHKLEKWKSGTTGDFFTDACMHRLHETGYISELCRQYASSFLVRELKVNWRAGSAYFEEMTIDFSPANNLGDWAAVTDSRIASANKNLTTRFIEATKEEDIKKWVRGLNNASSDDAPAVLNN